MGESFRAEFSTPDLLSGAEAEAKLLEVLGTSGSMSTLWPRVSAVMRSQLNSYGPSAVWSAGGSAAFHSGTEHLRVDRQKHGWNTPRQLADAGKFGDLGLDVDWNHLEQTGIVVRPDGDVAVSLVAGNSATATSQAPQVKRPRGYSSRIGDPPNLFQWDPPAPRPFEWWFCVHRITTDGAAMELSLPESFTAAGLVRGWSTRIRLIHEVVEPAGGAEKLMPAPIAEPTAERRR